MRGKVFWVVTVVFLIILTLPYLLAWAAAGQDWVFVGFLINPLDGNSYFAKMQQGAAGDWLFRLPFTAEPGEGSFLFIFYLTLGHIARIVHAPLWLVFHAARLAGALALAMALRRFVERYHEKVTAGGLEFTFALCLFGSGLGWLASLAGGFTADLWVAEAFPFFSALVNPHFPIGLALLLILIQKAERMGSIGDAAAAAGLSAALALVMPFGVVVLCTIQALGMLVRLIARQGIPWLAVLASCVPGGLLLVGQYLQIVNHPELAQWNQQNVTLSPPAWDVLVSFSPALILAGLAIWRRRKNLSELAQDPLVIWVAAGVLLSILPFNLQRRFLLGLCIPLAVLAGGTAARLAARKKTRWIRNGVLITSILTNILILLASILGAYQHPPKLYLQTHEYGAMRWLAENSPEDSVILASEDIGMMLPGQTGRRVVYGHPYETTLAETKQKALTAFLMDPGGEMGTAREMGATLIFWGPREKELSGVDALPLTAVYSQENVSIYRIEP